MLYICIRFSSGAYSRIRYKFIESNKPLYNFLVNKWYFDELYDITFIQSSKKIGLFFWKVVDIKVIDKFGPDGLSLLIKKLSLKANKFQSGFIYQYAFMILIGFSALLTFLIIWLSDMHKFFGLISTNTGLSLCW